MKDWQQRVIEEKEGLDVRIAKLSAYRITRDCEGLDQLSQALLSQQEQKMQDYSDILNARIIRFEGRIVS